MKSTSFTPGASTSAGVARSFTCCICRLNKPPSDLVFLSGCSHGYCTMCTVRHLTAKVEQGVAVIACPMCGFGTFEPEMCKPLVAREVFDRVVVRSAITVDQHGS
ncbi:hypothetical protein HPP92_012614 [Vanilla planifolia]|uniref:RING-type domain-containing protein n=1 Tax=Vanilla planifolia TaxID=51239 RepID=A0A835UZ77_VANPL|nr:hypothetical protein HPP92_012614 [Vanilla planifolia]